MTSIRQSAIKALGLTIGISILIFLGLFATEMGGFDAVTFSGISQAQEKQPPGKKGADGPMPKGQGKGQAGMAPGSFGARPGGLESVKTQIKATDEEWKVIGPKLRDVMAARRAAETGMGGSGASQTVIAGGGPGGGFGPFGGGGFNPPGGPGGFGPPGGGGPGGFGPPGGGPGGGRPPGGGPGGGGPGGPGRGPGTEGNQPPMGLLFPPSILELLNLNAEQKPRVEALQKELDSKLTKILTEDQNKQLKEMRESRGGPGIPPLVGPILLPMNVDKLNLTAEQKPQVEMVQKEIDSKLATILTDEQNKLLTGFREQMSRMGPGQPPGFGPGPPGIGGGGPPGFGGGGPPGMGGGGGDSVITQALNELQAAIDEPMTDPTVLQDKVAAVRSARKKAREKLAATQKELLLLITPDQEAVLVKLGYID